MSYLNCAPERRKIQIIDKTLCDGRQNWWGMKMRHDMGMPIAGELGRTDFHTIDLAGSSIFEVLARRRREDACVVTILSAQ